MASTTASRSSRVLPSVKCSSCALIVPLSSLSDHVCPPHNPPQPRMRSDSHPPPPLRPDKTSLRPSESSPASHVPFPSVVKPSTRTEIYMPGGESGMAGVGRRAFQAAAHAAVFTQHRGFHAVSSASTVRRGNPPQFLDIGAARRGTPPLSPNSTHSSSRSHSPHSPFSQSSLSNPPIVAASPELLHMSTPSRSYSNPVRASPPDTPSTPTPATTSRLPFFERYKHSRGQTPPTSPNPSVKKNGAFFAARSIPPRPVSPADSDESSTGLAYDRDDDDKSEVDNLERLSVEDKTSGSTSSHSAYSAASKTRTTRDDLLPTSPRRSHTIPTAGPHGGSGGVPSPLKPSSPPATGAVRSVSDAKSVRRDKELGVSRRVCIRCERTIDDGRWVRTETNKGVLCERCWKNMYLPKCRRCDKPIETAAVFSSDGQLKGKYHRACFTCHVCHQPFPDKSFYVYDGHPLCAFHYHKANRSLCTARACGRPIEGPCAVTEAGDRFHPDCLRCEHAGCRERLEDYWEIDGMVLCECHAQRQEDEEDEEDEEDDVVGELGRISFARRLPRLGSGEVRAQKRTTRLINLSGTSF